VFFILHLEEMPFDVVAVFVFAKKVRVVVDESSVLY
jgi:hypothetical protein